jgi:hypothetical protein
MRRQASTLSTLSGARSIQPPPSTRVPS